MKITATFLALLLLAGPCPALTLGLFVQCTDSADVAYERSVWLKRLQAIPDVQFLNDTNNAQASIYVNSASTTVSHVQYYTEAIQVTSASGIMLGLLSAGIDYDNVMKAIGAVGNKQEWMGNITFSGTSKSLAAQVTQCVNELNTGPLEIVRNNVQKVATILDYLNSRPANPVAPPQPTPVPRDGRDGAKSRL